MFLIGCVVIKNKLEYIKVPRFFYSFFGKFYIFNNMEKEYIKKIIKEEIDRIERLEPLEKMVLQKIEEFYDTSTVMFPEPNEYDQGIEVSRLDRLEPMEKELKCKIDALRDSANIMFIGPTAFEFAKDLAREVFTDNGIFSPDEEDLKHLEKIAVNALWNSGQMKKINTNYATISGRYLPSGRFGMSF